MIVHRDQANNGMTRQETIQVMIQMKQTADRKRCENHLDYLIRERKLKLLKRGGRVSSSQPTTTKRSQITVEQQLRWHTLIDAVMEEQKRLNLPADEFEKVKAHFTGNMDECCLLARDRKS